MDDYTEAEFRSWFDVWTGKPSVGYEVYAGVGKILFRVWSHDFDARESREPWPVGNAMWADVGRIMDLLISRYTALGIDGLN